MKCKSRFTLKALSSGIAAVLLSSAIEAGTPINIEKEISTAGLWTVPSQITFYLYDSKDSTNPLASQTFDAGQWLTASEFAVGNALRVSAIFTNLEQADTSGQLWVETAVDDMLVGARQELAPEALLLRDISVETYIESRAGGFIFPDNTVQTTAGIVTETDPNLAAHEANASAHHAAYSDASAVAAIKVADGSGSGLDADLLDGQHGSAFAPVVHSHAADYVNVTGDTMTGKLTINSAAAADLHGDLLLFETDGTKTVEVNADLGKIELFSGTGVMQLQTAGDSGTGGFMHFYSETGMQTVRIDGDASDGAGYIRVYNSSGNATITLDGEIGGDGRITTQELVITGGSDLSEQFDINALKTPVEAGMLVSIDPQNPGELVLSHESYDYKVAGIISGAGGVKPGMMMGQEGSIANGEYPVALTGRVYALVDTKEGGEIKPGDLLTTSSTPGYAMKATDVQKRSGAVIGKAMTFLKEDKGLVLVLVSLQ